MVVGGRDCIGSFLARSIAAIKASLTFFPDAALVSKYALFVVKFRKHGCTNTMPCVSAQARASDSAIAVVGEVTVSALFPTRTIGRLSASPFSLASSNHKSNPSNVFLCWTSKTNRT